MISNSLFAVASFSPNSLQSPNAWVGHLPFAAWVIQEVSPKIFVELGTHSGNSYFSFCQSVVEAGISSKCYAVDTWQGDIHSGQYGDEIFTKVNAHNQERYVGFSRLIRMTFDDAITCFTDESIGLLHIDGLHTYEAARHDFETWLPKLAPGAVVMIHDISVRERDFGVWKIWEELRARYPNNLEFAHAHGLGVLQLNNASVEKKLDWLQPNSPEKQRLKDYFVALGSRQLERFELIELKKRVADLNKIVAERDRRLANLNQLVAELDVQCLAIQASLSWRATAPLREISARYPRFGEAVRSATNFVWGIGSPLLEKCRRRQERLSCKPNFSPPTNDYALAVPISYAPLHANSEPSLVVVCHLFFDDMAEEFKGYLSNIPFHFDLYITTDTNEKKRSIENTFAGWKCGNVEVRISQNRGRDIAPKLITCVDVYGKYEYVLHIHSKHSPHARQLAGWRKYLLETLIGSPEIVTSIFEVFQNYPGIGMIAPQHLEGVRPAIGWGFNYKNAKTFSRRLALSLDIDQIIDFPAGSMFWARSAALKPILDIDLSFDDFPVEKSQTDGTLAHVIERLYFHICEAAGFDWIKIAQPDLLRDTRHRVIDAKTPEELSNYLVSHRVRLLTKEHSAFSAQREKRDSVSGSPPPSPQMQLLRMAHNNSAYRTLDFPDFFSEVTNLAAGKSSVIDFDENFYLASNPDVNEAVRDGRFPCGYIHYCVAGKNEGRMWGNAENTKRFGNSVGKIGSRHHFVEDYERLVAYLLSNHPLDEAMSIAVGGKDVSDYRSIGQIESRLLKSIGLAQGMRLVDLGCGSGRLASALHNAMDISYVGIDIIQAFLDYAKKKAPTFEFVLHRQLSIPLPQDSADMICAFSLFTHLLHTETYIYLEDAVRVLKPCGRIVFSFLEFSEPAHWDIFIHTKNAMKVRPPHLNMFIERSAINTWASHLNLVVEKFISAADVNRSYHGLGQVIVVLRKH